MIYYTLSHTVRRRAKDYANQLKSLVDIYHPEAEKITVIHDNLNTHVPYALYETFEPQEAKRILDKLEIHYTPKHGSLLNMAEIELSVLSRQCLACRIPDQETLKNEIAAWEKHRNDCVLLIRNLQLIMLASNSNAFIHQFYFD